MSAKVCGTLFILNSSSMPGWLNGRLQVDVPRFRQPRGAEHERPVVLADQRQHQALRLGHVVAAAVEQRLDQPERRLVVEVVHQLDVAAQRLGDLGVQRLQREALGLLPQHVVELRDGGGELQQMGPLPLGAVDQRLDLGDPRLLVVDERTAQHGRVLYRGGVDLRRLDVRVHDLQMPAHHVHGQRGGRDQVRPRVPVVHQGLDDDVGSEVKLLVWHIFYSRCKEQRLTVKVLRVHGWGTDGSRRFQVPRSPPRLDPRAWAGALRFTVRRRGRQRICRRADTGPTRRPVSATPPPPSPSPESPPPPAASRNRRSASSRRGPRPWRRGSRSLGRRPATPRSAGASSR